MDAKIINQILLLRFVIAFLGEKNQYNWWSSSLLNESSKKMLEFTFPRTALLAQYESVSAVAAKVHDETIGVGKTFHLFRLPEVVEKNLFNALKSSSVNFEIEEAIISKNRALDLLSKVANKQQSSGEGPVNLGKLKEGSWDQSIKTIASSYLAAFEKTTKVYPYFEIKN